MSEFDSKLVQCPYYIENFNERQARNNQIRCEGVEDNNRISLVFNNKSDRHSYLVKYCSDIKQCQKCLIHKMLDEKYEVDDE